MNLDFLYANPRKKLSKGGRMAKRKILKRRKRKNPILTVFKKKGKRLSYTYQPTSSEMKRLGAYKSDLDKMIARATKIIKTTKSDERHDKAFLTKQLLVDKIKA